MPYTLLHCGVFIGETDFEGEQRNGHHRAGIFRPTAYGRTLLPRLTGILTIGADLKDELRQRGVAENDMEREVAEELLETSPAGRRLIDLGRVLSDVELHGPGGERLEFASIAFMNMQELGRLTRRLDCPADVDFEALPEGAPEFLVSVTFRRVLARPVRR
jgi:hypothetical protein